MNKRRTGRDQPIPWVVHLLLPFFSWANKVVNRTPGVRLVSSRRVVTILSYLHARCSKRVLASFATINTQNGVPWCADRLDIVNLFELTECDRDCFMISVNWYRDRLVGSLSLAALAGTIVGTSTSHECQALLSHRPARNPLVAFHRWSLRAVFSAAPNSEVVYPESIWSGNQSPTKLSDSVFYDQAIHSIWPRLAYHEEQSYRLTAHLT